MRPTSFALCLLPLAACWDGLRPFAADDGGAVDAADDAAASDAGPDATPDAAPPVDAGPPIDAAVPSDAASPVDAPPDAAPPIDAAPGTCPLLPGPASLGDRVGGPGGGTTTALPCPPGKVAVGLGITYSDQATTNGDRSAYGVTLACADVTVTGGSGTSSNQVVATASGSGGFGWTPATATAVRTCQAGWVMTGVSAYLGSASGLFANVAIECRKVAADASFSGPMTNFAVTGSGNLSINLDAASCPVGAIVGLDAKTGAGLDAVELRCAPLSCAP
ncbi:MAG: hypothetical protein R3B06_26355 [Kofleriaceae bacterium]